MPNQWRIAAGLNGIVGSIVTLMMGVHIAAVLVSRVNAAEPHAPNEAHAYLFGVLWDFRFYGLLLFGAVGIAAGVFCIRSAAAMFSGALDACRLGVRGSLLMLALFAPLIPLQPLAGAVTVLAVLNAIVLLNCHRRAATRQQRAAGSP